MKYLLVLFGLLVEWSNLQAQWVQTNGPYGGIVRSFASIGSTIFLGTDSNGVFVSTNNGDIWTTVNNGLTNKTIRSLAAIDTKLFAATNAGVFLSTNQGASWLMANNGLATLQVNSLVCIGDIIYAGTGTAGVFKSTNFGTTWESAYGNFPSMMNRGILYLIANGSKLFCAFELGGIVYTTDGGATWNNASIGWLSMNRAIALSFINDTIYASTWYQGTLKSTDNGQSWKNIGGLSGPFINMGGVFIGYSGLTMYRSTNFGVDWLPIGELPIHPSSVFHIQSIHIFFGSGSGVYLSGDTGVSWVPKNTGLQNSYTNHLVVNGTDIFAVTLLGVTKSTDLGNSWDDVNTIPLKFSADIMIHNNALFVFEYGDGKRGIYRSTNGGVSWSPVPQVFNDSICYDLQSANGKLFAFMETGVFVSTNDGNSWMLKNASLPGYRVMAFGSHKGKVFFALDDGSLNKSEDDGENLEKINLGFSINANCFASSDTNVFIGTKSGVLRSTDDGITWQYANAGLNTLNVSDIVIIDSTVIVSTMGGGIFVSKNRGNIWISANTSLSNRYLTSLEVLGNNLFAGTFHSGVWRRSLNQIIASTENLSSRQIIEYSLVQNYPNPFNSSTMIKYSLPHDSRVRVIVYNTLGQVVEVLVDQNQTVGWKELRWNASVSSGLYFYRIDARASDGRRFTEVKKMVLVR